MANAVLLSNKKKEKLVLFDTTSESLEGTVPSKEKHNDKIVAEISIIYYAALANVDSVKSVSDYVLCEYKQTLDGNETSKKFLIINLKSKDKVRIFAYHNYWYPLTSPEFLESISKYALCYNGLFFVENSAHNHCLVDRRGNIILKDIDKVAIGKSNTLIYKLNKSGSSKKAQTDNGFYKGVFDADNYTLN